MTRQNGPLDISFVIITYNDGAKLSRAISSAALAAYESGLTHEIWVVDNGSMDHTKEVLTAYEEVLGGNLKTLFLGTNTGTTYSRNRALEKALGRYICVMDSDASFLDNDLNPVLNLLADLKGVGLVGPRIIMPDGSTYNSVKRLPTLWDKLAKLPQIFLHTAPHNRDWYDEFPFNDIRPVQSAISCCWFFRKDLFQLLGPLDERIFYAPEDVDYCLRSWKKGRAVVYFPFLRVLHHTQQISHKKPLSKTALSHFKGLLYYLTKHGYWFSRKGIVQKWVTPLARILGPELALWQEENHLLSPGKDTRP